MQQTANKAWTRAAWVAMYAGFAATGVGCALPGVLLPALLAEQHWQDGQGGRLFLLIALGSAMGPLLVTMRGERAAIVGCLLVAVASVGWSAPMGGLGLFWALGWGLGLGMTMTGISLVSQRLACRGATDDGPGVLTRLNFLWAAGACSCPLLVSWVTAGRTTAAPLRVLAIVFGVLCCGMLLVMTALPGGGIAEAGATAWRVQYWDLRGIPLKLLAATALATGVEASGGGWLATYAARSGRSGGLGPGHVSVHGAGHGLAITVAAPSCFWAGLLLSRALSWLRRRWLPARPFVRTMLVLALAAAGSLLLPFRSTLLLGSSFTLGFGLGPLYPELLARVLGFRHSSLVFFVAGLASAFMPWATGVVSTAAGSLRWGLLVPAAGALLMVWGGWSAPRNTRE